MTSYKESIIAFEVLKAVQNELAAGTVHFRKSTNEKITSIKEIIKAMKENDLLIEFHCQKCGTAIIDLMPIEKRLCQRCLNYVI